MSRLCHCMDVSNLSLTHIIPIAVLSIELMLMITVLPSSGGSTTRTQISTGSELFSRTVYSGSSMVILTTAIEQ